MALGDRAGLEVPLSEMEKHHQVAAPYALPLWVPLVGPGVSLTEHPLLSVQRRARACAGACTTLLPTPLQTPRLSQHPLPPHWAKRGHVRGPRGTKATLCASGGDAGLAPPPLGEDRAVPELIPRVSLGAQMGNGEPVPRWYRNFAVTRLCPPSPSAPEFLAPSLTQGDWL